MKIRPFVGECFSDDMFEAEDPRYGVKDPSPGNMIRSTSGSVAGADRGRQQK